MAVSIEQGRLDPELARLTRDFHTRPGAAPGAIAAAVEAARTASAMLAAGGPLPADYLDFLAYSNGAYGQSGPDGLWVRLDPIEDVLPMTRGHGLPPGLLLIGVTRLGDGLAIDTRTAPALVVTLDLGWWGALDVLDVLGPSLEAALRALETMGPAQVPWSVTALQQPEVGYVPTPQPVVAAMLRAAELKPRELVYDLGCGDGRFIHTAVRDFGARGVGFDLNMVLIQAARAIAATGNLRHAAVFRWQDLYTVDVSPADVVVLFLLPDINARLMPQLRKLRPGARVVTYQFTLPGCEPARTKLVKFRPGVVGRIFVWQAPF